MQKRIYAFLEKIEIPYGLQFGFRVVYSTTHIHMTEITICSLDSEFITCGIFLFKKPLALYIMNFYEESSNMMDLEEL